MVQVDVDPVLSHLGRDIRGCAARSHGLGHGQINRLPPVDNQNLTELAKHDVVGFEIAVQNVLRVRKGDCVDDILEDLKVVFQRLLFDHALPRFAANLFHHIKWIDFPFRTDRQANVMNRHDVWVFQTPRKLCLSKELVFDSLLVFFVFSASLQ